MTWGWAKKLGNLILNVAPIAATVADAAGVPYAGRIGRIVQAAALTTGNGPEKAAAALRVFVAEMPDVIVQLEKQLGRKVTPESADAYIAAQIEAHYQLLRANGGIEK